MSSLGLVLGLGAGYWPHILQRVDFTTRAIASNVYTLPAWLAITCATTNRTVQTSASTVVKGLGANAARARSVDGTTFGLSVEKASTNAAVKSETLDTWTLFTATVTANTDTAPDGTSTADRIAWSGNNQYGTPGGASSGAKCMSIWMKQGTSGTQVRMLDGVGATQTKTFSLTSSWARGDLAATFAGSADLGVGNWTTNVPAGNAVCWGGQYEGGLYPTSYIPTTSGSVTRDADVLSVGTPSNVSPNGFFDMAMTFAPNYANTEQANDHDLLFFDSNNRVFLQQSTSKIVLRVAGSDVVSSALTWSRNQAITIRAIHRTAGRTLVVSGATTGNGSATGSAQSAISLPSTVYLIGNASGAQEAADLQKLMFRKAA